jgi:hypothetical protein
MLVRLPQFQPFSRFLLLGNPDALRLADVYSHASTHMRISNRGHPLETFKHGTLICHLSSLDLFTNI